jgi:spermidine synthase
LRGEKSRGLRLARQAIGLIGLMGVIFHRTIVVASDFSFAIVIPSLPAEFLIHAYKWCYAALLILPQSVLLGMTFSLVSGGTWHISQP